MSHWKQLLKLLKATVFLMLVLKITLDKVKIDKITRLIKVA